MIEALANGRPAAFVNRESAQWAGDDIQSFRIECVSQGRLEFVPVPKPGLTLRSLQHDESGDDPNFDPRIPLSHGRIAGASAAKFSRDLLKLEGEANGRDVSLELIANGATMKTATSFIVTGFTRARGFMLSECGRIEQASVAESPPPQASDPPGPEQLSGAALVSTTSRLTVQGVQISLRGVDGVGGSYVQNLISFIREQGGSVSCTRDVSGAYDCRTATGVDLAAAILLNGSGRANDAASEPLKQAQERARQRRAGIWASHNQR